MNFLKKLEVIIKRRAQNEIVNFLQKITVFSKLTRSTLGKMCQNMTLKVLPKDAILFKEGQLANKIYIILSGDFEVFKIISP